LAIETILRLTVTANQSLQTDVMSVLLKSTRFGPTEP